MTIVDTFYLLFRTDSTGTKKDIADLEKQIDSLTLKGKKRTDAEDVALKNATKRHKELTSELKEQTKQTDQLGDSFAKTIESGVAALTGFATFSGLKSGILDAQQFNRELAIQSKISGQNATELKAYGAAYESAGGSAEGFLNLIKSATAIAAQAGRPLRNIRELFDYIRADIRGLPLEQAQLKLQTQYGLPVESLAFFEQSDKDYRNAIRQGHELAQATAEDTQKADAFGQAWSHVSQALESDFTHLGSDLFPSLTKSMEDSAQSLSDLTKTKGGVEALFAAVAIGAPIATALLTKLAIAAVGWASALSKAVIPLTLFLEVGKATGDVFAGNSGNRQSLLGKGASAVSDKILDWWYGPVQKAASSKRAAIHIGEATTARRTLRHCSR